MTTAILLVEARGQSVHCREDACVNLVQAAWLARELVRAGVDVRLRLIADAGQSIEEYSILCHAKDEAEPFKERIVTAADPRETRYGVVRELRGRLPFTAYALPAGGMAIEERLFYSPLVARIDGVNDDLLVTLRDAVHPLFDPSAVDELELLIRAHAGKPYLDLDLAVAQRAIAIVAGDEFEVIDIATVSRPEDDPRHWLHEETGRTLIENDLLRKQGGESSGFHDRLIGVFASVTPNGEERPYFNSPTCCRVEHDKVRLIARDRFNVLGLAASERITFDRFRELLDALARDQVPAHRPLHRGDHRRRSEGDRRRTGARPVHRRRRRLESDHRRTDRRRVARVVAGCHHVQPCHRARSLQRTAAVRRRHPADRERIGGEPAVALRKRRARRIVASVD